MENEKEMFSIVLKRMDSVDDKLDKLMEQQREYNEQQVKDSTLLKIHIDKNKELEIHITKLETALSDVSDKLNEHIRRGDERRRTQIEYNEKNKRSFDIKLAILSIILAGLGVVVTVYIK